jgi:hypothetical protein
MDIELQKEKFWDWYFIHQDDDLDKSDFLKAAFLAGIDAAQQSVQPTVLKHAQFCASRGQGGGACDCQPANTHSG